MLRKALLIFNTVRFLKGRQLFYQIYYRVKSYKDLNKYRANVPANVNPSYSTFTHKSLTAEFVTPAGEFNFLNLKKKFEAGVDWDFQGYGKLWNYNLQYFNYLNQDGLPDVTKLSWLTDLNTWLKNGKLKLEPYPVSLRVMNVIRYLSDKQINNFEIIKDTYAQLEYLNDHLEYHLLGNHLLENAFALMMGGSFFKNTSWEEKGKNILYKQLDEQILHDGAHFELSPMYHQIIFFRLLELIDWYSKTEDQDSAFLDFLKQKAAAILAWLQAITFSNGDIPHLNDSTVDIAFTSAELFSFAQKLNITANSNHQLGDSGYRMHAEDKYECVIDVAEVGPTYQPGHAHSDALSFVLYAKQKPLLVDVGTSTYQIGKKRSYERSTNAHNTVEVGGINQSQVWGGFRVGRRAEVEILDESAKQLVAQHNGYQKTLGAIHKRSFTFSSDSLLIKDLVSGADKLQSKALFHLHPDCEAKIENKNIVLIPGIATISFTNADDIELQSYEFAAGFNKYRDAVCICVKFAHELQSAITFL